MLEENLYGLKEIHTELLKIFSAFDDLCRQNEIEYSAFAGTMLGAVREKGFIPWDDDIDVVMDMDNYSLLCEIIEDNEEYCLDCNDAWVPRFRKRKEENGMFIDIFLLTGAPKGIKKTITVYRLKALQGMLKKYRTEKKVSLLYKILLVATRVIGKLFSRKYLLHRYWKVAYGKKYDSDSLYIPNIGFQSLNMELEKLKLAEGYEELPFENTKIRIFKEYDYILTVHFGPDYMTPVKESERIPLHADQIQK